MQPNELRQWRIAQGYTQQGLADELGYTSRSYICMLENGTKTITPRVVKTIAMLNKLNEVKS